MWRATASIFERRAELPRTVPPSKRHELARDLCLETEPNGIAATQVGLGPLPLGVPIHGRGTQCLDRAKIAMPISSYYRLLRDRVGSDLLLVPAVAAVLRNQESGVLIQRNHHGGWSLPAGAIEPIRRALDALAAAGVQ